MTKLLLFTDGSVHVQSGIGYGAFLFVSNLDEAKERIKKKIKVKRFEQTSSTKLELQIFLYSLEKIDEEFSEIVVYSDSQNLSELVTRRQRLEQNNFCSKTNRPLNNAELYRTFYSMIDKFNIQFVKLEGHKPSRLKNKIDKIFSLVDKASRQALRNETGK